MSEIPADDYAFLLCVGGDGGNVEELASVELDAGQEEKSCGIGVFIDCVEDLLGAEDRILRVLWLEQDHGGCRVLVVMEQLRFYCVLLVLISNHLTSMQEER